ncbi:hypothetical protein [Streptomyces sp. KL116D]|uniref:hypothetical protein n=1 Tax=Streptomyces sp. KL116D TaxID=3045152 RepID=UPI003555C1A6
MDSGVGQMVLDISKDWSIPTLLLAWLIAVVIRLATVRRRSPPSRPPVWSVPSRPA